jgi:hypothetical protein
MRPGDQPSRALTIQAILRYWSPSSKSANDVSQQRPRILMWEQRLPQHCDLTTAGNARRPAALPPAALLDRLNPCCHQTPASCIDAPVSQGTPTFRAQQQVSDPRLTPWFASLAGILIRPHCFGVKALTEVQTPALPTLVRVLLLDAEVRYSSHLIREWMLRTVKPR